MFQVRQSRQHILNWSRGAGSTKRILGNCVQRKVFFSTSLADKDEPTTLSSSGKQESTADSTAPLRSTPFTKRSVTGLNVLPELDRRDISDAERSRHSNTYPRTITDDGSKKHLELGERHKARPEFGKWMNFLMGRRTPNEYCNNTSNLDREDLPEEFTRQFDYRKYEDWKKTQQSLFNEPKPGKVVHPPGAKREIVRSELYGMKIYNDQGPRDHLGADGPGVADSIMWSHTMRDVQPQKYVSVDGQTYLLGVPVLPHDEKHWNASRNEKWYSGNLNSEYYPRMRLRLFANYDFIMKCDYAIFWIPSFIVLSLSIPAFCMSYLLDELAYTSMTIKVIGRQWYWVYEVESPVDDDEELEDEEDDDDEDLETIPT